MKKLREDAIPPSSLHNSEARRRGVTTWSVCARVRVRARNKNADMGRAIDKEDCDRSFD